MLSVRFLLAGALMWVWSARRGELAAERPGRRQWAAAAIVGGALLVLDTGGVAWAELRVSSGIAALLIASVPLFMAILDRTFFGVRMPVGGVAGIATGLLGVGILVGPSGHIDALGSAVLLLSAFAWAAGSDIRAHRAPAALAVCLRRDADAVRRGDAGSRSGSRAASASTSQASRLRRSRPWRFSSSSGR